MPLSDIMSDKLIKYKLFNDFILNEIKTKEDALKQLMSIDALLIGAYSAVWFGLISKVDKDNQLTDIAPYLLISPIIIWICSFYIYII